MTKNKTPKRKIIARITILVLLALSALFFVASQYKRQTFGDAQIDEVLFYLFNGFTEGQSASLIEAFQDNLLFCAIIFFLLLLPVVDFYRNRIIIKIDLSFLGRKKALHLNPSLIPTKLKLIYAVAIFIITLRLLLNSFGVVDYLKAISDSSQIFEENYIEPSTAKLIFPENKRNLIFIYLESMENTVASRQNGGQAESSLIPELEQIALDPVNVSFSNQATGLGGAQATESTTWTVAGMLANSAGIPLKSQIFDASTGNEYGQFNKFMPGAYTLGDILRQQGYNQTFVMGSNATFGGRDKLLKQHGDYQIHDYAHAVESRLIGSDYHVWWGYEDRKLFDFAKAELNRLSELNQPFNLQLLTADTHFVDGFLDPTCPTPHSNKYDNVYSCASRMVGDFLHWVKSQPFADNTTIVLIGDHLGMQTSYYDEKISSPDYRRTTYNVFINSALEPTKRQERLFSPFDIYPTTLAAMDVKIDGNKLALGTNLFSDQPTLVEKYGSIEAFNSELSRRSIFYENNIIIKP